MAEQLYLREELEQVWRGSDVFHEVLQLSGEVYRSVKNRRTLRVELGERVYFAKIHGAVGWLEILKNLITLRYPVVGAGNEYRASEVLQNCGVEVPGVAAFGMRGMSPAARESFILTDAVEPSVSLEDYCRDWAAQKPAFRTKRILIHEVADITKRLHAAGLNHRDLYICHFLLDQNALEAGEFRLILIDLHRAQKRSRIPRRWLIKDLGSLQFSCLDLGLEVKDWMRFIARYTGKPLREALEKDAEFWSAVQRRAEQLYAKALAAQ